MKRSAASTSTEWPDIVDAAREVYNRPVDGKQGTLDAHGTDRAAERVAAKLGDFIKCFSSQASIIDVTSKKVILSDRNQIKTRYQTVFRESGQTLKMAVTARVVFLPWLQQQAQLAEVLVRIWQHTSLVTPSPSSSTASATRPAPSGTMGAVCCGRRLIQRVAFAGDDTV